MIVLLLYRRLSPIWHLTDGYVTATLPSSVCQFFCRSCVRLVESVKDNSGLGDLGWALVVCIILFSSQSHILK